MDEFILKSTENRADIHETTDTVTIIDTSKASTVLLDMNKPAATTSVSAHRPVKATAPQRPVRNSKSTNCVTCSIPVRAKDDGLQCDFCCRWEHLECSPVSVRLHGCIQEARTDRFLYICAACNNLRRQGQSVTLPPCKTSSVLTVQTLAPEKREVHTRAAPVPILSDTVTVTTNTSEIVTSSDSDCTVIETSTRQPSKRPKKRNKKKVLNRTEKQNTIEDDSDKENEWMQVGKPKDKPLQDKAQEQPTFEHRENRFPSRDRCVMIFRLPESEAITPSSRYDDDVKQLQAIVSKLLEPNEQITLKRAIRIGKHNSENQVPRPLKLVLSKPAEARLLVSRGHKLKDSPWSLRPDLSPEERERQRAAVQTLRERQGKGETNLIIRNFQVVRKRLYKKPVLLRAEI